MIEGKENILVGRIEKLIVDGNKEVLEKLGELEVDVGEIKKDMGEVKEKIGQLDKKVDRLGKTVEANAQASYGLLTAVRDDVKEVKEKLEKHIRLPVHA